MNLIPLGLIAEKQTHSSRYKPIKPPSCYVHTATCLNYKCHQCNCGFLTSRPFQVFLLVEHREEAACMYVYHLVAISVLGNRSITIQL